MIRLKISPFFIIFALILIALGYWYELIVYAVCILLHEMAHAEVAQKLGYTLNHIKLMPYGASLTGEFEGVRWTDEVLIAIAGPLFNLAVALSLIAVWWLVPITYVFTDKIVWASFFTAIFNLLPIFPLDGGRVLLAVLSAKIPRQKIYIALRTIGYIVSAGFLALFVMSLLYSANITLAFIFAFLLVSTIIPDKSSKYQKLYSLANRMEKLKKGIMIKQIIVLETVSLIELVRIINSNYYYKFEILNQSMQSIGIINENRLECLLKSNNPQTPLCIALQKKLHAEGQPPKKLFAHQKELVLDIQKESPNNSIHN